MPPKNRNKFGLTIPVDPRWKAFENPSQGATSSSKPQRGAMRSPRPPTKPAPPPLEKSETEELQRLENAPPFWKSSKTLSKQLSMVETSRDRAWEKRRKQVSRQEKRRNSIATVEGSDNLTDEDLNELRGSIELGFGFSEEDGSKLSETLPALDLYFAVNRQRQLSLSPVSTPRSRNSSASPEGSPTTSLDDSWRICAPGDSPKQVKTKLRHWAQAVACSVMQSL